MARYEITSPSGKRYEINAPDNATQEEILAYAQSNFQGIEAARNTDVPLTPEMQGYAEQRQAMTERMQPEPSMLDKLAAGAKAGGVMLGNAIPATIGQVGGTLYGLATGGFGKDADRTEEMALKGAQALSPFSTNDPLAQQYIGQAADVLGALDPAAGAVGVGARAGAIPAATAQLAGKAAPIAKEVAQGAELASLPFRGKELERISKLAENNKAPELSRYKLEPTGSEVVPFKAVADKAAIAAEGKGIDQSLIRLIQTSNAETKKRFSEMTDISQRAKDDLEYGALNRPENVVGKSLQDRLDNVLAIKKEAGQELDTAIQNLKGEQLDFSPAVKNFTDALGEVGVTLDANNIPQFKGSRIEFSSGDKRLINNITKRMRESGNVDAYTAHDLKKLIDTEVEYGTQPMGKVTSTGESIIKGLRGDLNNILAVNIPEYGAANKKYSATMKSLEELQTASGNSVDLLSKNADKSLGRVSRRVLSNAQSRDSLIKALETIESTTRQYGKTFDDDLIAQAVYANELDKYFGAHASRSLQSEVGKPVDLALSAATGDVVGLGKEGIKKVAEKVSKKTPSEQRAEKYRALRELTRGSNQ